MAASLTTPERNNYFYGLLLDEARFEREVDYFNQKRWLLNRLLFGTGVVCGLEVTPDTNPDTKGNYIVSPGVAIDGLGREIVVPNPVSINPNLLTDETGQPAAGVDNSKLCLAYVEKLINPVPVLVTNCDMVNNCRCDTIRESFVFLVQPWNPELLQSVATCEIAGFPPKPGQSVQDLLRGDCAPPPDVSNACVPLAYFSNGKLNQNADNLPRGQALIAGNRQLLQLISCLINQQSQQSQSQFLLYVSGDGQSTKAGTQVPNPLTVKVIDGTGQPKQGVNVQFTVTSGGGAVSQMASRAKIGGSTVTIPSGSDGTTAAKWTLGKTVAVRKSTEQQVTVQAENSAFTVIFTANAK